MAPRFGWPFSFRVRKLITPIRINIAEQKVNVAGNLAAGAGNGGK